ncbi:MAG TPA: hypothetical protein VG929_08975 [Actinomycetota bacterium]|nr:hypothetical protein [Actinomycetota bacterium]
MRKLVGLIAVGAMTLALLPGAHAGPGPHGVTSDNVEHVGFLPFNAGTATGASFFSKGKDDYMVVTSWRDFAIYNINDPVKPVEESRVPFGFKFENEDVSTNGRIMLFSESLPGNILHVWDIEDVTNPVQISQVKGAGDHTTSCILDCKWAYGDSGHITDLRNPAKPVLMKEKWGDGMPPHGGNHDVTEVAPGLVLTSTNPMLFLDARKDPVHPKFLAMSEQMPAFVHSNLWPRNAKDNFALSTGETWTPPKQCGESSAGLTSWSTKGWQKTKSLKKVDTWTASKGTQIDGNPIVSGPFGCSSHWFDTHPKWHNGGLVAAGWYNSGTRFLQVDGKGKISEAGYFLPNGGGTSAAYWVDSKIVYAVDYQRGIDILRYNGK